MYRTVRFKDSQNFKIQYKIQFWCYDKKSPDLKRSHDQECLKIIKNLLNFSKSFKFKKNPFRGLNDTFFPSAFKDKFSISPFQWIVWLVNFELNFIIFILFLNPCSWRIYYDLFGVVQQSPNKFTLNSSTPSIFYCCSIKPTLRAWYYYLHVQCVLRGNYRANGPRTMVCERWSASSAWASSAWASS